MDSRTGSDDILRRHQAVYGASKALPAFEFSNVGERLMAGRNPLTSHDIQSLHEKGVTHLLDLREVREWTSPRFGIEAVQEIERLGLKRLHLPIVDMGEPSQGDLSRAAAFIEEALREPNSTVYVHCRAGMERTAAILIAFHARRHRQSYEEALAELRRGRGILRPLPHQERAARKWITDNVQREAKS